MPEISKMIFLIIHMTSSKKEVHLPDANIWNHNVNSILPNLPHLSFEMFFVRARKVLHYEVAELLLCWPVPKVKFCNDSLNLIHGIFK